MNSLEFIDKNEIDYEKKVIIPLKHNLKLVIFFNIIKIF